VPYKGIAPAMAAVLAGDIQIDFWYALLGPGGIPGPLLERIQRDASALLNSPDMKQSLAAQGCIAVGGTPEALSALIRSEYQLWSKVVKAGGIRVE